MTSKKELSERDICTQFIVPALQKAGWDIARQVREEVFFTDGRIVVKGSRTDRGERKRADFILYHRPNIPIAVIEAKDNKHAVGAGLQQALNYARILDLPTALSSNGDGFVDHDGSGLSPLVERNLTLDEFPSPEELWQRYKKYKGIVTQQQETIAAHDYFFDGSGRSPRYYQQIAVNRAAQIKAEKERLVKAGKIRQEKPLPPISDSDKPFDLPVGWVWCRFGDVIESTEAGTSYLCKDGETYGSFWGVIKTSAITTGLFLESENKLFSEHVPKDCSKQICLGDLLFCRASGSKGLAGRCCMVRKISRNLLLSDKSIRIHPSIGISKDFIEIHNKSKTGISYFETLSTQKSTSMNNVTRDDLLAMPIPLPPLAEQQAIVARVNSLMATIDTLEAQVTERKEQAQLLMQAVLREAFSDGESVQTDWKIMSQEQLNDYC